MLYPRENACRERKELTGLWDYRFDWKEEGRAKAWHKGIDKEGELPVPASWNELFTDDAHKHFFGTCWYQMEVLIPEAWRGRAIWLRVGSVNYRAEVWVNGQSVGAHDVCHLPFEFSVEQNVTFGAMNRIVIAVNGELNRKTIPPGGHSVGKALADVPQNPDVSFDFFPFCGIHRPVVLYTTTPDRLEDLTVTTSFRGSSGIVKVAMEVTGHSGTRATICLAGQVCDVRLKGNVGHAEIVVPKVRRWSPEDPYLYDLTVRIYDHAQQIDEYTLPVGIRTIAVKGSQLLLNGKPIYLKGFGKHEDFHASGRGLNLPVLKRDFELLKWIGANSFRTSHYPYAEEVLDMADREGFLVISETSAVGIRFEEDLPEAQAPHQQAIAELMSRDKNHPCVIMWSLANEPNTQKPAFEAYFKTLMKTARKLDATRPFTIVSCDGTWCSREKCRVMKLCDVIVINRYYGWYMGHGRLAEVTQALSSELDDIYREYKRPVMIAEFGGDCLAGLHSLPATLWSEEYQAELLEETIKVLRSKKFVTGEHIWNFADFLTGQSHTRAVGNKKGVFTRERQPKMAAHAVRRLWKD
jgi:beta-glucuronidase